MNIETGKTESQKPGQILLVDDDEIFLATTSILLRGDYEVRTASSVAEARALLRDNPFDVLVSDLRFEGQDFDGISLMDWVSDQYPEIGVIVLSSDPTTERVVKAMLRTPISFITKPGYYIRELKTAIQSAIATKREAEKTQPE